LRELSALPERTVITLGGTTFALYGNAPHWKFTPWPVLNIAPPPRDPAADALRLYGTEINALETIQRHLDTMGDSLDPKVRKRAERLCQTLARGHYAAPVYATETRYIRQKIVQVGVGEPIGYEFVSPFCEVAAAELGRKCSGYGYNTILRVSAEEIEKLREKFIITTT
jgi:hypothetical protein